MTLLGLAAGTFLLQPAGVALGVPWLLPVLNAMPAYLVMVVRLRNGDRRGSG